MVYAMWTVGDKKPEMQRFPKGLQAFNTATLAWQDTIIPVSEWEKCTYRWPVELPEQRPTAFGLLSEEEQEEFKKVHEINPLEVWENNSGWTRKAKGSNLFGDGIYRKSPEPQEPEITVTVNGELIDFRELVRQEVARIYEVQDFTNGVPVGGYPGN